VFDVSGDRRASGGEIFKAVRPCALLFESVIEPLAQAVLLGRVGGDLLPRCARPADSLRLAIQDPGRWRSLNFETYSWRERRL
jgi:hypothetical protein